LATRTLGTGFSFAVLALCATPAGGCLSSSSSAGDGGGGGVGDDGGSSSGASSSSGSGGSSSSGTSDATGSSSGSGGGGTALTPDPTGYVSVTALGIQGAWYGYGDGWGTNGAPPGVCETVGMHMTSACSSITFPMPPAASDAGEGGAVAVFTQMTPGTMCLSGTAAKVVACVAGVSGCTGNDYSNIFGVGIGLDFDNVAGVKTAYNAPMNKVTGFSFTITGVPTGGIRVELPTTDTTTTGSDSYAIVVPKDGSYTANLVTGAAPPALSPSFAAMGFTDPPFNAAHLLSIQFHVPTSTGGPITVANMCVSNLTAIVSP
jgi:hypothetical protein